MNIAIDPLTQAFVLEQIGQIAVAERLAKNAVQDNPSDAEAFDLLIGILRKAGKHAQVDWYLAEGMACGLESFEVCLARGVSFMEEGAIDAAISQLDLACRFAPEKLDSALRLASLLLAREPGKAVEVLGRYCDVQPLESHPPLAAARFLLHFDRPELGEHFIQRFAALEPESAEKSAQMAALNGAVGQGAGPKRVAQMFDAAAADFDAVLQSLGYAGPSLIEAALQKLDLPQNSDLAILDAGCGTGLCGPILAPVAARLDGVDLSAKSLDLAKLRACYSDLSLADLSNLPNNLPRYDLIVLADVLTYFNDLKRPLGQLAARLHQGGRILAIISDPKDDAQLIEVTPSGRFHHSWRHVYSVAEGLGMTPRIIQSAAILRTEYNTPVYGTVFELT